MYPLWNHPLLSIVTLESWRRKWVITSRAAALLGDLGGEVSSRQSFMGSSYDLLTVVPLSRRIIYGGDICSSDFIELCSKGSVDGDATVLSIWDTGMRIFLMVPRVGVLLWWMDTRVTGGKGSWIGSVLFTSRPQVRPPSKQRELGKLVMGSLDSLSQKSGGR